MTARKNLEQMLEDLTKTLGELVKEKDCPAGVFSVARQLLKDNGIEARRTKDNPLGALANSLPTFDREDADDLDNIQH